MDRTVRIHPRAYIKAILHACKYPHAAVNGVLVGYGANDITDAYPLLHVHMTLLPPLEIGLMHVEQLLSLLHSQKKDGEKEKKLKIVGYYFANEHLLDRSMAACHKAIIAKIRENCFSGKSGDDSVPCVWLIDNSKMQIERPSDVAIGIYRPKSTTSDLMAQDWTLHDLNDKQKGGVSISFVRNENGSHNDGNDDAVQPEYEYATEEVLRGFSSLVQQRKHRMLVDFDDHLDDIRKDWTNKELASEIAKLLK